MAQRFFTPGTAMGAVTLFVLAAVTLRWLDRLFPAVTSPPAFLPKLF